MENLDGLHEIPKEKDKFSEIMDIATKYYDLPETVIDSSKINSIINIENEIIGKIFEAADKDKDFKTTIKDVLILNFKSLYQIKGNINIDSDLMKYYNYLNTVFGEIKKWNI